MVHSKQIRVEILNLLLEIHDNLRSHPQVVTSSYDIIILDWWWQIRCQRGFSLRMRSFGWRGQTRLSPKNGGSARPVSIAVPVPVVVVVGAYHAVPKSTVQLVTRLEVGECDLSSTVLVSSGVGAIRVAAASRER